MFSKHLEVSHPQETGKDLQLSLNLGSGYSDLCKPFIYSINKLNEIIDSYPPTNKDSKNRCSSGESLGVDCKSKTINPDGES